jgi:phosphopantothenoylcysteine decarboxylase / phosphopantothenate---cysteine ligase
VATQHPQDLAGKHLVLALSGGIACYKAAELCRAFVKAGATVQVVMSEAATHFITTTTMQALSGRPVFTDQWDARAPSSMAHIDLSREADAIVIAPASADLIAQLAQGRAGSLLPLLCVARPIERCALLVAPAMNREMWAHPATQRNVAQIQADGAKLLGPGHGDQACGEFGDGRMLEPDDLLAEVIAHFQPKVLLGQRVLITAGPTFEAIDPVRGITNLSSGKMGFAVARAAAEAGADVTLVAGPVSLTTPRGVRRVDVSSARQMFDAVMSHVAQQQIFIATAAVADWRPAAVAQRKIKKQGDGAVPTFEMVENPDILASVAKLTPSPYCVGFAAESHDLVRHARDKRLRKGIPLIVANLGPATFGADDNQLVLVDALGETELPRADKLTLARQLIQDVAMRVRGTAAARATNRPATKPAKPKKP